VKLTSIVIGVLLFTGCILGMTAFYGSMIVTYAPANSTTNTTFDKFNQSFTTINEQIKEAEDKSVSIVTKDVSLSTFSDIAFIMFDLGGILLTMSRMPIIFLNEGADLLPFIPNWFVTMVGTIIAAFFVLKVASLFMKTDEI